MEPNPEYARFCLACGRRLSSSKCGAPEDEVVITNLSMVARVAEATTGTFRLRCKEPVSGNYFRDLRGATVFIDSPLFDKNGCSLGQGMRAGRIALGSEVGTNVIRDLGDEMSGGEIEIPGDCHGCNTIGRKMSGGTIRISGSVTGLGGSGENGSLYAIGSGMSGGQIAIRGDVRFPTARGDVGTEMVDGRIQESGSVFAGSRGSDEPWSALRLGTSMQRGTIAIGGNVVSDHAMAEHSSDPLILLGTEMGGLIRIAGSVIQPRSWTRPVIIARGARAGAKLCIGGTCYPGEISSDTAARLEIDGRAIALTPCHCGRGFPRTDRTVWTMRSRDHFVCQDCKQAR